MIQSTNRGFLKWAYPYNYIYHHHKSSIFIGLSMKETMQLLGSTMTKPPNLDDKQNVIQKWFLSRSRVEKKSHGRHDTTRF
jgi:hypothetical protein